MELMEAIKGRRSIRRYTSKAVDDKTLEGAMNGFRHAAEKYKPQ